MAEERAFNDWALKKWSLIFSAETRFDKNSYLITSIVPISYIKLHQGSKFVVVELEDLRRHTPWALQGCKHLVTEGCAQWIEFTESPKGLDSIDDHSQGILAIGKVKGFGSAITYFMEETLPERQEEFIETLKVSGDDAYAKAMETIDAVYVTYEEYCNKNGLSSKASQIYRRTKNKVNQARASKMTRNDLLEYLYLINAMVFDLSDVPTNFNSKFKELTTATSIASKLPNEELIQLIPYFVLNYHNFARKGSEETTIYNLSFNLNTCLTKMRGKQVKKTHKPDGQDTL